MKTSMLRLLAVNLTVWLFTSTAPLGAQTCTNPPAGLVAWWSGDGHSFDLVGANHGDSSNGVGFAPGRVGRAFSFDGVSSYVQVTNTAAMDFGPGDFTIEGWLNFKSLAGDQEILHKVVGLVPNCQTYFLEFSVPNALRFMVYESAGNQNDLTVATSLVVDQWCHVAAVRSGNTNLLFLDGSLIGSQVAGNSVNTGQGGIARIGNIAPNGVSGLTRFFDGMIDELSLYNRALSSNEIAVIHAAGGAGKCKPPFPAPAGLMSWWPAEDSCLDRAGINHGTPVGAVGFVPGKVGQAFDFNGVDRYVVAPPILTNAAAFTFEWWMNVRSFTHPSYMVTFSQVPPTYISSSPGFNFYVGNSGASFGLLGYWTDGAFFDLRTDIPFGTGVWKHVAVTYDGTALKQYVDGALLNQGNYADKTSGNAHPFLIGKGYAYPGSVVVTTYFDGQIDEFTVYNRALSPDEIAAIFAAGSAGKAGPPTLTASLVSGGVLLSWPTSAAGYGLVSCTNLATAAWEAVTNEPSFASDQKEVLLPATTPAQRFFQLIKPNP